MSWDRKRAGSSLADARAKRFADFPVMAKRIHDTAHEPAVLFPDREDLFGAGSDRLMVDGFWVFNN